MLREPQPVIGTGEWDNLQCRRFKGQDKNSLAIGDIVLVREGQRPLALCQITSDSFESEELEITKGYGNKHYRNVRVLTFCNPERDEGFPQPQGTLQRLIRKDTPSWQYIRKLHKTVLDNMETARIVDILKSKHQIILQGAPGTGKTYQTAAIALSLIGIDYDPANHKEIMEKYRQAEKEERIFFTTFHQSVDYEDFVEGLKPKAEEGSIVYEIKDGLFKTICEKAREKGNLEEFDRAMESLKRECAENPVEMQTVTGGKFTVSYRDGRSTFVIRLEKSDEKTNRDFNANIGAVRRYYTGDTEKTYNLSYVRGIGDYLVRKYGLGAYSPKKENEKRNYVLIIDEINRGNLSKIFGELITLLEADKRSEEDHPIEVILPYSQERFTVPSNLYIIGTMNTTDRSIGSIDYAIRRRFAFYTLKANKEAIRSYYAALPHTDAAVGKNAEDIFDAIREFIESHKSPELDLDDLMVGHSYFMAKTADELRIKLRYEILPLIREYEKDGLLSLTSDERKNLGREWESRLHKTE